MSRPVRCSIAVILLASAVSGGGVALGHDPSPSGAPSSDGPAASAAPSSPLPSGSPPPILREDFTAPSDEWWTGDDEGERTSFDFGRLRTVLGEGPRRTWQWMELPAPVDKLEVQGVVTLDEGDGGGGVTCGPAGEAGDWLWGGYNTDGQWLLGRLSDGHIKVDARGELPIVRDPDAPVGGALPVALRLECTAERDGAPGRAVLWTKGVRVGEVSESGIRPFGKAGFLAAIDEGPMTIVFDDLVVWDRSGEDASSMPAPPASPATASSPVPSTTE
jgi:hypothetical protein